MSLLLDIASFVYEGLDEQELVSKFQDASEVHVNKPLTTPEQRYKKKKREVDIGLANNAFGAAAGLAGTKMAWDQAKRIDPNTMKVKPKPSDVKTSRVGLALKKIGVKPKVAAIGAGTAIVGTQLINGGMDAQSAQYFARERAKLKPPKNNVKKMCDEIIEKRQKGLITTDEAIELIDKAVKLVPNDPKKLVSNGRKTIVAATGASAGATGYVAGDKHIARKKLEKLKQSNINPAMYEYTGEVTKADSEKKQVFGWCSLSKVDGVDVVDRQGDFVPLDEMENSAYSYVIHSRKGGDMHQRVGDQPLHTSDLIESFVVTPEKLQALGLPEDAMPHGWWVGFKVNDDTQWENVKKGERVHFSIHGKGRREPHASV